ncbi:MAG: AAA domain-containing protein, partial [Myxococcota bacterium]|nr:AAA domain-containing protein [Myxococcota bacterium]
LNEARENVYLIPADSFTLSPLEPLNTNLWNGQFSLNSWNRNQPLSPKLQVDKTYFLMGEYKRLWQAHLRYLLRRHLDHSALSYRFLNEKGESYPYTSHPNTVEIYLFAPKRLCFPTKPVQSELKTRISPPPTADQKEAILRVHRDAVTLIQGPPGTGKSTTILAVLDDWLHRRSENEPARILITAANYAAMAVVAEKIQKEQRREGLGKLRDLPLFLMNFFGKEEAKGIREGATFVRRFRGGYQIKQGKSPWRGVDAHFFPDRAIVVINEYALVNLQKDLSVPAHFDMMVVDEASQLSPDHFIAALAFAKPIQTQVSKDDFQIVTPPKEWTKIIIVGDGDQLSAVRKVAPPEAYKHTLSSIYSFYDAQLSSVQLSSNFRSLSAIVASSNHLQIYRDRLRVLRASESIPNWIRSLQFPWEKSPTTVSMVVHTNEYDAVFSELEAELCAEAVYRCFVSYASVFGRDADSIKRFFEEEVGVVTPHNLHRQKITTKIKARLSLPQESNKWIANAVRTVDKFQGSDRSCMIASMGVSLRSRLKEEERFLYQINRFNVTISRPKFRLVFFCSQNFLHYIPQTEEGVRMMRGLKRILHHQLGHEYRSEYNGNILQINCETCLDEMD